MVSTSLRGKTLGVAGPGAIGQALFRLTEPFEFRKLAYGGRVRPERARALGFSYVELDELCEQSDIIVLACPLNAQTRGLMSAERLARLKPTALLVNVARGAVIDEAALALALSEKRIAAAGLDVFHDEPTPADNPLLSLPNVVSTPHALAVTDTGYRAALDEVAQGMSAVLQNQTPTNLIPPPVAGTGA